MFYENKEAQDKEMRKQIQARRDAASVFPYLRKTIEAFDGKVFNCRLEKSLKEDGNYWTVELRRNIRYGDLLNISFCKSGEHSTRSWKTVCSVNLGTPGEKNAKWDGKRIPAAVLVEESRKARETLLQEAANLEEMIEKAPELEKQLKYFISQIDKIVKQIPYEARSVYNLGYYVHHS